VEESGKSKKQKWEKIIPWSELENTNTSVDTLTEDVITLIANTITDLGDDDGWAFLWDVGGLLQKKQPNFDPRNYGFNKLTPLLASTELFEIVERNDGKSRYKLIYVKNK
jgi:hypothetical protein